MSRRVLSALLLLVLASSAAAAASPKHRTLPNGLRLVLSPDWSTEVVAVEMVLDISAEDEPPDQTGIRHLVQRLLLRGTAHATGEEMGHRLAAVGGVVDTTVGLDYVEIYALVPADGFETAVELLAEAVRYPAFDPEQIERERNGAAELARSAHDDPFQETYLALRERLYPGHPYGELTFGDPATLSSLSRDDILGFYRRNYLPNRAVVAVCGGVGEVRAMRALQRALDDWPQGRPRREPILSAPPLRASEVTARERPLRRAHLIMGFPAPSAGSQDYYAVQVIDSILGGGSTARLPRKLREDLGLVYTVSTFYPTLAHDSHFGVYAVTEPYHVPTVKSAVIELLDDLASKPVSEEELARAKAYLLGSYALSHQRMRERAYSLAWYETLELGPDFEDRYSGAIEALTPSQVQMAAQRLFRRFVLAVTLPTT